MPEPFPLFGRLQAAMKGHRGESDRLRSPAETFEANRRFMPMMGITRIANITGLDSIALPTFTAIRPNSRSLSTAQGKGLDAMSARTSALMESIESWHAENLRIPLQYESYAALRARAEVADITRLPLAPRRRLRVDTPLLWATGEDLFRHVPVFVPYELVTMNTVRAADDKPVFLISTDGLASGNHLLEAVVHALLERIERDAVALWYESAEEVLPVNLDTVEHEGCRRALELARHADVEITAWDVTSDIGVPTYACYVLERPGLETARGLGFYHGFGCHLSPSTALYRAIIEAIQGRLTFISGSRDDLFDEHYEQVREPARLQAMWEEIVEGKKIARPFGSPTSLATDTFEGDLRLLLAALSRVGLDSAVVVDLAREELGIPVVKVVVPGLEILPEPGVRPGERIRALRAARKRTGAAT